MKIPTYEESKATLAEHRTKLHEFVLNNEPYGAKHEKLFRSELRAVVDEVQADLLAACEHVLDLCEEYDLLPAGREILREAIADAKGES